MIAEALFLAFPEWRQHLHNEIFEQIKGEWKGCLYVKVPCPTHSKWLEEEDNCLILYTSSDESTIIWDGFHTHFALDNEDAFELVQKNVIQIIDFLKRLINEEVCIAVAMKDGELRGSQSVLRGETPAFPTGYGFYIRSWKGTYDAHSSEVEGSEKRF